MSNYRSSKQTKRNDLPPSLQLFSIAEVAYILGISRRLVSKWINEGVLPAVRLGPGQRLVRIRSTDLETFIEKYRSTIGEEKRNEKQAKEE